MKQKSERFKVALVCLILLVLPLFSMYFHGRTDRGQTLMESGLLRVTAPGQQVMHSAFSAAVAAVKRYVYLVEVEAQNEELRHRVEELKLLAMRGRGLEEENQRLRGLLDFQQQHAGLNLAPARVIARETSPVFSVSRVRLDPGTGGESIAANMPVVTAEGVVGRVEKLSGGYGDVMLLTDSRSRIDVQVAGKAVSGMLIGTGDGLPVFRFPYQKARVAKGDVLITTGHDRLFPKGLVAAYLAADEARQVGQQSEVAAEPAVRFHTLQEVFVVTNPLEAPVEMVPEKTGVKP